MNERKRLILHRLLMLGSVLLFALVFFLMAVRGRDDLDAEFRYRLLDDGTIAVEGYSGTTKKLEIPGTIDGMTVSEIYSNAFADQGTLKSVTIPASVKRIGEYAFNDCGSLKTVKIEGNLEEIGRSAFSGCGYLRNIELPDSLTRIEKEAFAGCTRLTGLRIPSSCTTIGDDVFIGCESLTLDCSENELAAAYAEANQVPASFGESNGDVYLKLTLAVGIPVLVLAAILIALWVRRKKNEI